MPLHYIIHTKNILTGNQKDQISDLIAAWIKSDDRPLLLSDGIQISIVDTDRCIIYRIDSASCTVSTGNIRGNPEAVNA